MHFTKVKGILSPGKGMNLYRGCSHGCIYCDSRSRCYQINHDFEDIEVKENAVELLEKAKAMGYAVKLDTNGSFPETLQQVIDSGIVDYVAMDVKSSFEHYEELCGRPGMTEKVAQSIRILLEGKVDYEFRTTVVDELHTAADIESAACVIAGAKRYFLQNFTESDDLLSPWASFSGAGKEKLQEMLKRARIHVPSAELRGVDL